MSQEFLQSLGARFISVNGCSAVNDYGDWLSEHAALWHNAGVLDLSFRSRLCLAGAHRARFLHGQVTNDVNRLQPGQGCYAGIVTAKGKMESDANVFCLADELLLDFEPGLAEKISQRLEKYIVADDVQVVDAAPLYGLLSVQGPRAGEAVRALGLFPEIPDQPFASLKISDGAWGEIYLARNPRLSNSTPTQPLNTQTASRGNGFTSRTDGYDLFVPNDSLNTMAGQLIAAARAVGGLPCGWQAFETARIEAGIPRFGADMDENTIPLEAGLEARAISYTKGCYIGQEVINRIHSVGHVNRKLCGLRLAADLESLPEHGQKLFQAGKEAGYITSAAKSPLLNATIALGYVRREAGQIGTSLGLTAAKGESVAQVAALPFV